MTTSLYLPPCVHSSLVIALNACCLLLGILLLVLPITNRHNISAWKRRSFPIYPDGRPTPGSINAPYFPAHLSTSDNSAQIALGAVATLYGGFSTVLLYLQCARPRATDSRPSSPLLLGKTAGVVAVMVAGGATALAAAVAAGLSFGGNDEGAAIDLRSVGYWPWQNMFPTIQWSIEGWACKVYTQLGLTAGTVPEADFAQMCQYAVLSKWTTLVLLVLGFAALALGASTLAQQQRVERRELADPKVDPSRDAEKGGKEP